MHCVEGPVLGCRVTYPLDPENIQGQKHCPISPAAHTFQSYGEAVHNLIEMEFFKIEKLIDRTEVFEHAISHANDIGLLTEEIDPGSGEQLGNFPQAFSHIGLINAAWAIHQAESGN